MTAWAGVCPQRRIVTSSDSEVVIGLGGSFHENKRVSKVCGGARQSTFEGKQQSCLSLFRTVKPAVGPALILLLLCFLVVYGAEIILVHANDLGRHCSDLKQGSKQTNKQFKFAMVTCSDGASTIPQRSFEGLLELVTPNKRSYANRHGYDFFDASDLLDRSRPPSWSKILAVREYLPHYDWIFWNDVDSLVTNPLITLEDILGSMVGNSEFEAMPDFIVTEDVTGINAGMFFVKNSKWSRDFLDSWWNQTSFIRPFGHVKSGDNDALKFLIANVPVKEKEKHVKIPVMQCIFNSHLWKPSFKNSYRLLTLTRTMWQGVYAKGDFMVHLAGLNDKKKWIKRILEDIEDEQGDFSVMESKNIVGSLAHRHQGKSN